MSLNVPDHIAAMPFVSTRRAEDCEPATCPNGKCNATGECIEQTAREMRELGEDLTQHLAGRHVRCDGCDGYNCDNGCAYPGVLSPPLVPEADPQRAVPEQPVRQRLIDADSATRKTFPMARGLIDYFPDALAAVAHVSYLGNEKHNPGEPMHHARGKSTDHADCILRHLVGRGGFDGDIRESAALAWRALALLQEELETEMGLPMPRGAWTDQP